VLAAERLGRLGDVEDPDPVGDRLDVAIGISDEGAAADQDQRLQAASRARISAKSGFSTPAQHGCAAGKATREVSCVPHTA